MALSVLYYTGHRCRRPLRTNTQACRGNAQGQKGCHSSHHSALQQKDQARLPVLAGISADAQITMLRLSFRCHCCVTCWLPVGRQANSCPAPFTAPACKSKHSGPMPAGLQRWSSSLWACHWTWHFRCHAIGCIGASLGEVIELPERGKLQRVKVQLHLPICIGQVQILAVPHYLENVCKAKTNSSVQADPAARCYRSACFAAQCTQRLPIILPQISRSDRQHHRQYPFPCRHHRQARQHLPDLSLKHICLNFGST